MNVRDSEFDRLLSEWLEDDTFIAPARPVEAAVEFARIHPRRRDWLAFLRRDVMTTRATTGLRPVAIVIALALLLVAGIAGAVLIGSDPDPTPSPDVSATLDASPSPLAVEPLPSTGRLASGRYTGGLVAPGEQMVPGPGDPPAAMPVDAEFTVGNGWSVTQPAGAATCCWYLSGERRSISYWAVTEVYPDACGTSTPEGPIWEGRLIGPSVEDLVNALDDQLHTEMSEPIDVTIGGYPGKYFVMTPSTSLADHCTNLINVELSLSLWPDLGGDRGRGVVIDGGPGEDTQPVYVIDVDGHRVVFVAWTTGVSQADAEAVADVMESMEFSVR